MFNADRKEKFMSENEHRNEVMRFNCTLQFNAVEPEEERLNKDLCDFTLDEIVGVYKQKATTSLQTLMMFNSYFKMYTDWCVQRGYVKDNQNHFAEISYETLTTQCINNWLKGKQIFTRDEILQMIKQLDNPADQFLVLALFEGVCGYNSLEVANVSMANLKGNKLVFEERTIQISKELVHYLKLATSAYDYYTTTGEHITHGRSYDKDDVRALKRYCNGSKNETPFTLRGRVARKLRIINDMLGTDLGTKSLMYSGMIHMIHEYMETDKSNDASKTIIKHKKEIEARYGTIASVNRFCIQYADYL